jgi:hypothetical protein
MTVGSGITPDLLTLSRLLHSLRRKPVPTFATVDALVHVAAEAGSRRIGCKRMTWKAARGLTEGNLPHTAGGEFHPALRTERPCQELWGCARQEAQTDAAAHKLLSTWAFYLCLTIYA